MLQNQFLTSIFLVAISINELVYSAFGEDNLTNLCTINRHVMSNIPIVEQLQKTIPYPLFVILYLIVYSSITLLFTLFISLFVGLSRVALGCHYPSDVLTSYLLGIIIIFLIPYLNDKYSKKYLYLFLTMDLLQL